MELSSLNLSAAAEQGYTFNLIHPVTGEELDGTIKVRGDKSKVVQAFARNRIRAMQLREKVQKGKNKDTDLTIEELEDMAIESAIVRIITWSNIKKDGEEIPFTKENAEMVLREHDWIRQQIQENAEDLSLFFDSNDLEQALEFAEQEFALSERQGDGKSLREHLEAVYKQTKKKPKELEELIELPDCMQEYWSWFLRLNARRPSGMGVSAIPYSEMLAFFELIGVTPDSSEIEVLEMFDRIAIKAFSEQQEKEQKRNQAKSSKKSSK